MTRTAALGAAQARETRMSAYRGELEAVRMRAKALEEQIAHRDREIAELREAVERQEKAATRAAGAGPAPAPAYPNLLLESVPSEQERATAMQTPGGRVVPAGPGGFMAMCWRPESPAAERAAKARRWHAAEIFVTILLVPAVVVSAALVYDHREQPSIAMPLVCFAAVWPLLLRMYQLRSTHYSVIATAIAGLVTMAIPVVFHAAGEETSGWFRLGSYAVWPGAVLSAWFLLTDRRCPGCRKGSRRVEKFPSNDAGIRTGAHVPRVRTCKLCGHEEVDFVSE
ncbi:hypothetical protein WMF31_13305 [Sorangium sp. So ce1036]|uniref:hypothetical protein n=1 Tax=Sorangium sp. So ce1036 TaxID=3133328 RepID=UPI003EFD8A39